MGDPRRTPASFASLDGTPLGGVWHDRGQRPAGVVVLAGAMGVRRRYYAAFADHLAARGLATLSFDYRGVGDSRTGPVRGLDASMLDWAEKDLGAAAREAQGRHPGAPLLWVGHSLGGQLMGFVDAPVKAALFVASQSGYWKNWDAGPRGLMRLLWAAIPPAVSLVGYLPMRAFGQGEDVPAQVARDWATWGRRRGYLQQTAEERGGRGFARWTGALRAVAVSDDRYAPLRSVEELVRLYRAAKAEVQVVTPQDAGGPVGHFGFFRPEYEATLWRGASDWLLAQAAP